MNLLTSPARVAAIVSSLLCTALAGRADAACSIEFIGCIDFTQAECNAIGGTYLAGPCFLPDADGDGLRDEFDGCPNDPGKIAPGVCGCGETDVLTGTTLIGSWGGTGSGNGTFDTPRGIALSQTRVYVADAFNHRVQVFNHLGQYLEQFGGFGSGNGQFISPDGITADAQGNLLYVTSSDGRVQLFALPSLTFVLSFSGLPQPFGVLDSPHGIAVDDNGFIYVSDAMRDNIQVFTSSGVPINAFGSFGGGNGQFNVPLGIALDDAGLLYIADTGNDRVQIHNIDGTYVDTIGGVPFPDDVAIDSAGRILVAHNEGLSIFDDTGMLLYTAGGAELGAVAASPGGLIHYVTNLDTDEVTLLQPVATDCVTGACCEPDGSCSDDELETSCDLVGGTFFPDTACGPVGACCFGGGSCSDLTELCCTSAGGTFTAGGSCGPTGACCLADGSCSMMSQHCCEVSAGVFFQGFSCGPPAGCCLPNGDCLVLDPLCCSAQGGVVMFDECLDAQGIAAGTRPFTTIGATTGGPPLPASCDKGAGLPLVNDIWFRYFASCSGSATVSLCNSDYDTRLAVYEGDQSRECLLETLVACNDDFCGVSAGSESTFSVNAGALYLIRIGGYSGSGTGEMTITCQQGTCCFDSGVCMVRSPDDCAAQGGLYQGDGTTCSPNPCPQIGACCFGLSCAADTNEIDCDNAGGTFLGAGSSCTPDPCTPVTGACCDGGGFCIVLSQSNCVGVGGTYQGDGTPCAPSPCTLGACCFGDGSCTEVTEATCVAGGGTFSAGGVCAPAVGCCLPGGSCATLSPECCVAQGGVSGTDPCAVVGTCVHSGGVCVVENAACCAGLGGTFTPTAAFDFEVGGHSQPRGVEVGPDGRIYVAEDGGDRVRVYDAAGAFLFEFGQSGSGDGDFNRPTDIALDASGNIYVAEFGNQRVQVFDAAGGFLFGFSDDVRRPRSIAVDAVGRIYLPAGPVDEIRVYDALGALLFAFGSGGTGDGEFATPRGLALDGATNIYVTDRGNDRVQVFDSTGVHLLTFGSFGTGPGEFANPDAIAVDAAGLIYVADTGNDRVQVFDATGTFLGAFGSTGTGGGDFNTPQGVTVDASGRIYVADEDNGLLQTFEAIALCGPVCPEDLDGSGDVGFSDILQVIGNWGPCGVPCPEDLSGNGQVDFADILTLIGAWGPCGT